MACTIRIAVETAKFGQPEVTLGLLPGGGGTQRLPRLVGKGRALQLILSGEMISAQEAYRIGLVNEIVPAADLITRAEAILKKIASNAPIAVKFALEAANKGMETSQGEGLLLEASYFGLCAATEDKKEGTTAFLEKRTPSSRGGEANRGARRFQETAMANDNIFSGLKVVDLASFIAGPSAAVILSDFGADVIKVEPPTGDLWRTWAQDPAAAAGEGRLSLASGQPQQARHHARSEIAERSSRFSRSSSNGPTCSSSTPRIPHARN